MVERPHAAYERPAWSRWRSRCRHRPRGRRAARDRRILIDGRTPARGLRAPRLVAMEKPVSSSTTRPEGGPGKTKIPAPHEQGARMVSCDFE